MSTARVCWQLDPQPFIDRLVKRCNGKRITAAQFSAEVDEREAEGFAPDAAMSSVFADMEATNIQMVWEGSNIDEETGGDSR